MKLLSSACNLKTFKFSRNFVENLMKKVVSSFLSPLESEVSELTQRIEKLSIEVSELEKNN